MALPPDFLDELRARIPLPALIGRHVRLSRSGRNWKGCCPFHDEKTPSFYVFSDHYHCFGCGAHGDALSFVMQREGLDFMEAVRRLAAEAGLRLPEPAPPEARAARAAAREALTFAQRFFAERLAAAEGEAARTYLAGRGIGEAARARFALGFAPSAGSALLAAAKKEGLAPADLAEAGLVQLGEDGEARDFFRRRLMIPIHDRDGRVVGFGGRVIGEGQPKYLNGPETALFAKRRLLFNLHRARKAVREGAELLVVEGYLDVIALDQAGFAGAVAPLGTALGAEQIELLWQIAPSPILCFDGDSAGLRASERAARAALPRLSPERGLRFLFLPPGEDPDSYLRSHGAAGFASLLATPLPFAEAFYEFLAQHHPKGSPEGRAALRAALDAAASAIGDRALASEYRALWRDRFFGETRPARRPRAEGETRRGRAAGGRNAALPPLLPSASPRDLPTIDGLRERWRILLATLIRHPRLLAEVEEDAAILDWPDDFRPLVERLLNLLHNAETPLETLDSAGVIHHLQAAGLGESVDRVLAERPVPLPSFTRSDALPEEVAEGWRYFYRMLKEQSLAAEISRLQEEIAVQDDPALAHRLCALVERLQMLIAGETGP